MIKKFILFIACFAGISCDFNDALGMQKNHHWNKGHGRDDVKNSASVLMVFEYQGSLCVALVQDKKTGKWTIPGGLAKKREHPVLAAKRELREETMNCFSLKSNFHITSLNSFKTFFRSGHKNTTLIARVNTIKNAKAIAHKMRKFPNKAGYNETWGFAIVSLEEILKGSSVINAKVAYSFLSNKHSLEEIKCAIELHRPFLKAITDNQTTLKSKLQRVSRSPIMVLSR